MFTSDLLEPIIKSLWDIEIPTHSLRQTDPNKELQWLPIQNILILYLADLCQLLSGYDFHKTIIHLNFWGNVEFMLQDVAPIQAIITN